MWVTEQLLVPSEREKIHRNKRWQNFYFGVNCYLKWFPLNTRVIGVCLCMHIFKLLTLFSGCVWSYEFDLILPITAVGVWLCLSSLLPLAMSPARQRGGREFLQEWRGGKVPGSSCSRLNVIYCTLWSWGSDLHSFCVFFCVSGLVVLCVQEAMTFYKWVFLPLRGLDTYVNLCFQPTSAFFKLLSSFHFFSMASWLQKLRRS